MMEAKEHNEIIPNLLNYLPCSSLFFCLLYVSIHYYREFSANLIGFWVTNTKFLLWMDFIGKSF